MNIFYVFFIVGSNCFKVKVYFLCFRKFLSYLIYLKVFMVLINEYFKKFVKMS